MTLFEAFDAGTPLAIELSPDNHRPIAALFPHPRGLIFADPGWNAAPSWHPFHVIEGPISGDEPPYTVGPYRIRQIDHGDPLADAWNTWTTYRDTPEGQWATPERARQMMQDEGLFDV